MTLHPLREGARTAERDLTHYTPAIEQELSGLGNESLYVFLCDFGSIASWLV